MPCLQCCSVIMAVDETGAVRVVNYALMNSGEGL